MAATYLASNGSGENDAGSDSLSFSTTRTIDAGERVVVVGGCEDPRTVVSAQVGSLSLVEDATTVQGRCSIFSEVATSEIASGATVTITYSASSAAYRTGVCFSLSNAAGSVGDTALNNGFSSTPTSGAADTTTGCIAVAAISLDIAKTIDAAGTYTELWESTRTFADTQAQYDEIASAGTTDASWTLSGIETWEAIVVVYPEQAYSPWPPGGSENAPEKLRSFVSPMRF